MTANLVWIHGFEHAADKAQMAIGDQAWTFSEYRGTIDPASTDQTHQPIGKSAPYAGSYSMKLSPTNHTSWPPRNVYGQTIVDGFGVYEGGGGRIVFSHYHNAGAWQAANNSTEIPYIFRIVENGRGREVCSIGWRTDNRLNFYVDGAYKETTTFTIPADTWTRIGVVFKTYRASNHTYMGARLYINGVAATSWYTDQAEWNVGHTGQMRFIWYGNHFSASDGSISTFVDHIVATSDDSISEVDGTTTSTGEYIDTETWLAIVPGIRPDADIASFESGGFAPNTGTDNFAVVNENPFSATNYVESVTDPSSFGCTFSNLDASYDVNTVIKGVKATFVAMGDGTMLTSESQLSLGSSTLNTAQPHTLNTSDTIVTHVDGEKPGGGNWTLADVNNLGFKYTTT